jgi:argininosuccinate lyase
MSEAIGSTGRIDKTLILTARRILFERNLEEQIHKDLTYMCQIDLAHVLMLAERRILSATTAKSLLRAITRLVEQRFAALKAKPSVRGLFLLYEGYLIETEGQEIGGMLQTGRSRNDLNATLLKLSLREPYALLIKAALRLQAVLIRRARKYRDAIMPAYTHSQAAMPTTYGHFLAGVAEAIRRDVDGLMDATREIDVSPLGAGAVAGTTVPIDPARTAELLGFTSSALHSADAVASRDVALRLLSAMAIYGATLSRIATDLLQWLTSEFQFLSLPDDLVGSSSAMPQKRNPFLLEHVQGRTTAALGAFVSSLGATRNVPFTNSISVGTESIRPLWNALADTTDATTLLRLVVSHARPNLERMERRASDGFTTATEIAVRMVMEKGMDFRSAHRSVGQAVSETLSRGLTSFEEMATREPGLFGILLDGIDPRSCVERAKYGGGPAPESMDQILESLHQNWRRHQNAIKAQVAQWKEAQSKLKLLVNEFSLA